MQNAPIGNSDTFKYVSYKNMQSNKTGDFKYTWNKSRKPQNLIQTIDLSHDKWIIYICKFVPLCASLL